MRVLCERIISTYDGNSCSIKGRRSSRGESPCIGEHDGVRECKSECKEEFWTNGEEMGWMDDVKSKSVRDDDDGEAD